MDPINAQFGGVQPTFVDRCAQNIPAEKANAAQASGYDRDPAAGVGACAGAEVGAAAAKAGRVYRRRADSVILRFQDFVS